jgi:stearoyl-CoA desaturase (Delta-9 desaturase)
MVNMEKSAPQLRAAVSGRGRDRAEDRPKVPLVVTFPGPRLWPVRLLAAAVVLAPTLGTAAAVGLALVRGVTAAELVSCAVMYAVTILALTIGFHRYFSHRTFSTSRAVQILFVILGSAGLQGPLIYWVSTHRRHHQFSDTTDDPHSPHFDRNGRLEGLGGFWQGHMGWLFARDISNPIRFAPDIISDRLIFAVQRRYWTWAVLLLALPPAIAYGITRDPWQTLGVFLWAGPVRILLVHHVSWAVGSFSHIWGSRPFPNRDRSANNWWVAVFAFGEGLQNNHHAFPAAAHHGLRWGEPDFSGLVIDTMEALGLVKDVNRPSREAIAERRRSFEPVNPGDLSA